MNNVVKASSFRRLVKRTRRRGLAKIEAMIQALRRTDAKTISESVQGQCFSMIPKRPSSKLRRFDGLKTEVHTSPSSRCSTPSPSRYSNSPDTDKVLNSHDQLPKDEMNTKDDSAAELINRLRSHQIEWAAMIELERSDTSGALRGMSARQIRRLIQQKRSEAWLTETDGPLYESDEECSSDDDDDDEITRQGSESSSITHYHLALEPSVDDDWSQYF
ncbi:hypothetical protein CROQUDRAFT_527306 [Cronartium quercuum f. sp. fusiforme G11]|uniref:Uncharacterized protein n=1 Tax=Cronartium quercuum f. sp. fusiforme G11 TaxID=708437 RepID=A0A9P6NIJ5_9BASI|nr:hypothetical protein CROQUDRAFT_527306 [Cronartium quercuum f. sp. fusiforme G11]